MDIRGRSLFHVYHCVVWMPSLRQEDE
jgi:hypothetical protein